MISVYKSLGWRTAVTGFGALWDTVISLGESKQAYKTCLLVVKVLGSSECLIRSDGVARAEGLMRGRVRDRNWMIRSGTTRGDAPKGEGKEWEWERERE